MVPQYLQTHSPTTAELQAARASIEARFPGINLDEPGFVGFPFAEACRLKRNPAAVPLTPAEPAVPAMVEVACPRVVEPAPAKKPRAKKVEDPQASLF